MRAVSRGACMQPACHAVLAALVLISLRLLGLILEQQTVPQVAGQALRLVWSGLAVTIQAVLFRRVASSEHPSPWLARTSVALSLAFWFAVSMAIGFV
jgi:hypothetical protein